MAEDSINYSKLFEGEHWSNTHTHMHIHKRTHARSGLVFTLSLRNAEVKEKRWDSLWVRREAESVQSQIKYLWTSSFSLPSSTQCKEECYSSFLFLISCSLNRNPPVKKVLYCVLNHCFCFWNYILLHTNAGCWWWKYSSGHPPPPLLLLLFPLVPVLSSGVVTATPYWSNAFLKFHTTIACARAWEALWVSDSGFSAQYQPHSPLP